MSAFEILSYRALHEPVLVLATEGWIDAGIGAAGALSQILSGMRTDVLVRFDADEFIDHRARRPMVRLVDGINTGLTWPEIELRAGKDPTGADVLVLIGPEPDMRWHLFVRSMVGLTADFGVRLVCGLGAFPAPVPHTRPVRLAATATTPELAAKVGFVGGTIEVPSGIHAALEEGYKSAGIPTVGIWARVPHYAAAMPYPAASVALIEGLAAVSGLAFDPGDLRVAAAVSMGRIDELISNSEEHLEMVRLLEAQIDAAETDPPLDPSAIPTGDEIAAELERFLRGETQ